MKKYLVEKFKGKGSPTGDMYYEVKVYGDSKNTNDISKSFFNELEKKSSGVINKENLTFNEKKNCIILQHGCGSFYSLLKTVYKDNVSAVKDNEYIITE